MVFLFGNTIPPQKDKAYNFKITVERAPEGVKLICTEGCDWDELYFMTKDYKPQGVDKNGLTSVNKYFTTGDLSQPNFLFTLVKVDNEITLKGVKGTEWTEIKFDLPKRKGQLFNEKGKVK
ncbi:hypothetical protein [Persicobacter diffluens]|uniref:Uncharacterized protein n=1 Tax=Persicobacter diffluens TaxID=981 RepID=A0AAN4W0X7_9BACT|nr:hypothetical protein PEDI_31500 [Persicobacter diffluens]